MDLASREPSRHLCLRPLGLRNSQFTIFNDRQFGTARVQGASKSDGNIWISSETGEWTDIIRYKQD
jgi:hypothetical protein